MNDTPAAGDILDGKYRVEGTLGEGGMGVVLRAQHLALGQPVAIKVLHAHDNPRMRARLMREAQAAAHIDSEHVTRVLDVGQLEHGAPYIVMELLRGSDLAARVDRQGALGIEQAVGYLLQACEALSQAHAHGLVHRDIKPANLFLAERPDGSATVKLLDFGIAKDRSAAAATGPALTRSHALLGSPQYMAPEQLAAKHQVDARTDIWSLGVTLYDLLTGEPAFAGTTLAEICSAILRDPPRPLRACRPEAPAALEQAILRCLHKDSAARFASVTELAEALGPFCPSQAAISLPRIRRVLDAVVETERAPSASGDRDRPEGLGSASIAGVTPAEASAATPAAQAATPYAPTELHPAIAAPADQSASHHHGAALAANAPAAAAHDPTSGSYAAAWAPAGPPAATSLTADRSPMAQRQPRPLRRRWRWLAAVGAVILLLLAGLLARRLTRRRRHAGRARTSSAKRDRAPAAKYAESRLDAGELRQLRASLLRASRDLKAGRFDRAHQHATEVLAALAKRGIVARKSTSELGAQAQRLTGLALAGKAVPQGPAPRGTQALIALSQRIQPDHEDAITTLVGAANWKVPAISRCAFVDAAALELALTEFWMGAANRQNGDANGAQYCRQLAAGSLATAHSDLVTARKLADGFEITDDRCLERRTKTSRRVAQLSSRLDSPPLRRRHP